MIRLAVTTFIKSKKGSCVWLPCEVTDLDTMEQVYERLRDERVLFVRRFETQVVNGQRKIINAYPAIIGMDGVMTIVPLEKVISEVTEGGPTTA